MFPHRKGQHEKFQSPVSKTDCHYRRLPAPRLGQEHKKILKILESRTLRGASGKAGFAHSGVHVKGGGFFSKMLHHEYGVCMQTVSPPAWGRQGTLKNF